MTIVLLNIGMRVGIGPNVIDLCLEVKIVYTENIERFKSCLKAIFISPPTVISGSMGVELMGNSGL